MCLDSIQKFKAEIVKVIKLGLKYNAFEISKKDETFFELDTWLGTKEKLKATTKENYYVTINKKDISHLTVSLEYNGPISAPIKKGDRIADIIVSKKNETIKKLPLYAAEDLKKVNFFKSLLTSLNYLIWGDV